MRFYYPALVYIAVIAASYALPAEAAGANLRAAAPMPVGGCITEDCSNQAQMRMLAKAAEKNGEERSLSFGWFDDLAAKLKGKTSAAAGAQTNDRLTVALAKANKAKEAKAAALAKTNKAKEAKAAALAKTNKAAGGATAKYKGDPRYIAALKKIKEAEDKKWPTMMSKYTPDFQSVANGYRNTADDLMNSFMTHTDALVKGLPKNGVFKKAEDQVEAMLVNIAPNMASKQETFRVKFRESYDDVAKNVKVGLGKLKEGTKEYEAVMLKQEKDVLGELRASMLKKLKAFE